MSIIFAIQRIKTLRSNRKLIQNQYCIYLKCLLIFSIKMFLNPPVELTSLNASILSLTVDIGNQSTKNDK